MVFWKNLVNIVIQQEFSLEGIGGWRMGLNSLPALESGKQNKKTNEMGITLKVCGSDHSSLNSVWVAKCFDPHCPRGQE